MTLEPGTRLGPYEIVELRGKGGMGEVYRARDTRLHRDVAVKVLPADVSQDAEFKRRFEREARTISQLQHQNVCTLYDIGSDGGTDYLVMEYLEGETLEDRLRKGPLPVDEMLRIAGEIAEAIDAAHQQDVVHRDLKPGNVMLSKTGTKVLDFGLAKGTDVQEIDAEASTLLATITEEGRIVGTMPYMAPEQLEGLPADPRSDVWALGCLIYEMVVGDRPFGGVSQASLITAIMSAGPEPVSARQPIAPAELDRVVARCLEKHPERRWQSARDVALELEAVAALSGQSPSRGSKDLALETGPNRRGPIATGSGPGEGATARYGPRGIPRFGIAARALGIVVSLGVVLGGGWLLVDRLGDSLGDGWGNSGDDRRLAVLPFESLGPSPESAQLAQGISERVVTGLSGVMPVEPRGLRVPAGANDICDVAAELGVRFVLEGSLQRIGGTGRASARVVDCTSGEPIWADTFDRDIDDPFAFQDQMAAWILNPASQVVYQVWARDGQFGRGPDDLFRFADAWGEVAERARSGDWYADRDAEEMQAVVRECLQANSRFWVCHQFAGHLAEHTGDREGAIEAMKRAVELSRGLAAAHAWLGRTYAVAGHTEEAISALETAMSLTTVHWWDVAGLDGARLLRRGGL
jgi:TolB-like protein/predicted Ser/Thr protein kinase